MLRPVMSGAALQGSWRGKDALWIAMEYCGGGSVSDLMQASDAPLEEDMIAYICTQTLAGLTYLHSIGKVGTLWQTHHMQHALATLPERMGILTAGQES